MKKLIFFSSILFFSCASEGDKNKADSTPAKKDSTVDSTKISGQVKMKTDSGTLIVNLDHGQKTGEASMLDNNGKLVSKGLYLNGEMNGAWLTYDANGKVVRAVHYGNGVIQHVLDADDFNFDTIRSKDYNISFAIPSKWKEYSTDGQSLLFSYSKEVKDPAVRILPTIKIMKSTLAMGDDLSSLAAAQMDYLHQNFGHVQPIAADSFLVNSNPAYLQYGIYNLSDNGVGFLFATIIHGNSVYYVDCTAQNYEQGEFLKYQGVFEMIVKSFRTGN
ncbi:MAG TPA: hypothetical protein VL651_12365 [Bacteroidia bacterium]|jgi:hypothetical protein|nr:hypothetical protein [Bacteroidia bacterium]